MFLLGEEDRMDSNPNSWYKPADVKPEDHCVVLVIIDGQAGGRRYKNCTFLASYYPDVGWALEDSDGDCFEFTVKYWTEIPEFPEELRKGRGRSKIN